MLRNVVGTVDLKMLLDLKIIALHDRNAEYNLKNALVTPLYWIALQIVITGGISEESCRLASRKFTRVIQYEPELFLGLIYKLVEPKLTLLIFVSGKIVLCGARDPSHLYQAIEKMYPVLLQYRKMTTAP
ncbi:hypothetical protein PsorP6_007622 [Peronosclerospora sorghi]|uniref:Uncharacterized protein n=1 Tax=Peronosclerospora sorghi TaxID=230839 RepID=A0ACC0W873_9STRA|nr:hypothetical protein PsorP6_007622 [Peronosclerospora sorghi]